MINIYSMESWKLVLSWKAHKGAVSSMWSDGQNELVTGGSDGWIKVWDLYDGFGGGRQLGIQAHNGPVASVQADGVKIVSGGLDGAVRVWNKNSGAGILEISGHTAYRRHLSLRRILSLPLFLKAHVLLMLLLALTSLTLVVERDTIDARALQGSKILDGRT